jgi:hexosaminidase
MAPYVRRRAPRALLLLPTAIALSACRPPAGARAPRAPAHAVIPAPAGVRLDPSASFDVDSRTAVVIDAQAGAEEEEIARDLHALLALTGSRAVRRLAAGEAPPPHAVHLRLDPQRTPLGAEGYELTVTPERVTLAAHAPAGLFYAVQTMRQLLPPSVEHRAAIRRRLRLPTGQIVDTPRFPWRGAMLDVARHFFGPADVKRYVDLLALYKLNRLHLHLADDQGWRLEIRSWPNLTAHGGSTQVGGGAGGYYTQAEYADLVAYARSRHVTVVPEIEMPGHTNAALASYPTLTCDGVARPLYTGTEVGFSTLCVERDTVLGFVEDVVREIAELTPGEYVHVGGDEVEKLTHEQYLRFVERVQGIVRQHGKQMIGWGEIAAANLLPSTVVQHWKPDSARLHAARGGRLILSPATRTYLDMKYDSTTVLGLTWAAVIEVRDAYAWEPAALIPGVPERAILGVEAPLWSETLVRRSDFEFMAFPRLAAIAEVGWSPPAARDWQGFSARLGAHGPRLSALGVNFYRSPQVPWAR